MMDIYLGEYRNLNKRTSLTWRGQFGKGLSPHILESIPGKTYGREGVKNKERRKSISVDRASGSLPSKAPRGTEEYSGPLQLKEMYWQVPCKGLLPLETLLDRTKFSRL